MSRPLPSRTRALLLCLLVGAAGAVAGSAVVGRPESTRSRSDVELAIAAARQEAMEALVFVKPVQEVYDWGERAKRQVYGSGVIFSPDGYVLTNNHVAEKSTSIRCVLADRTEVSAAVVGCDPETDLAVLKLESEEERFYPFARLGSSAKLEIGDFVMALGSPFGFERSLSFGVVSSTSRYLDLSPFNLWIQTDAAINPGNSGGPLVNAEGEVVGINSLGISGADNIGFAIPMNEVREVIVDLWKKGKTERSHLGTTLQALKDFRRSTTIEQRTGVLVSHVEPESPAEVAGLRAGDVLLDIGGRAVHAMYDFDLPEIRRWIARLPAGQPVPLRYVRGGVVAGATAVPEAKGKAEGEDFEAKGWGLTMKEIVRQTDPRISFFHKQGVYVNGIQWGGAAASAGFTDGDVLLSLAGKEIRSMADLKAVYEELSARPRGSRRALAVLSRAGYRQLAVLTYERDADAEAEAEAESIFGTVEEER